jgi:hypothetical protein
LSEKINTSGTWRRADTVPADSMSPKWLSGG